jgi:hypothetical protein
MTTANEERLLSLKEASIYLNLSPSVLQTLVARTRTRKPGPQITYFQAGRGAVKFKQEWLDKFVKDNTVEPALSVS